MAKNDYFGDVVFGVYQRGGNPDLVDIDRVETSRANGCDEDQAVAAEMHYQCRGRMYRNEWDYSGEVQWGGYPMTWGDEG